MLFLGTSETVGDFNNLFTALDRKFKLYQRKENEYTPRVVRTDFLPLLNTMEMALPQNIKAAVPKMALRGIDRTNDPATSHPDGYSGQQAR